MAALLEPILNSILGATKTDNLPAGPGEQMDRRQELPERPLRQVPHATVHQADGHV